MKITKSPTAAGVVTAASFAASAAHIFTVVAETNSPYVAWVYPIGIDGLIFVGLRAMQTGRKFVGAVALGIGATYSLLFNGHAEGALVMPAWLIAAAMPVAFFAAVLIETTAAKAEEIEEIPAAPVVPVRDETEWDRMEERVETRLRAEHALHMETMKAEYAAKFAAIEQAPAAAPVAAPVKVKAITDGRTSAGRAASWDVEKAVALIEDGRTDADVMDVVDGLTPKPLQRTKRAVRLLIEDASRSDEEVGKTVGQSAAHIARVRAAMKG